MALEATERWYVADVDDTPEWKGICRIMRELEGEWANDRPEEWDRFAKWVRSEALDQELFGEYIHAAPDSLVLAMYAFLAAADGRV